MVKNNEFREDLYYRLNILNIKIPPLRERKGDIKLLIDYFLKSFSNTHSVNIPSVTKKAIKYLEEFNWSGNTRQLKNLVLRMVLLQDGQIDMNTVHLCLGDQIQKELEEYGTIIPQKDTIMPLREAELKFRKKYITAVRSFFKTDSETAKHLDIAKSNFHRLLKELNLK